MSSGDNKVGNIGSSLSTSVKNTASDYNWTQYVQRFFYQIIGIYFPASILFLYIFLFWYISPSEDPISYYLYPFKSNQVWPDSLINNISELSKIDITKSIQGLQAILFVIAVVILGEGINAITSKFAMLSPVSISRRQSIKFGVVKKAFPGVSNQAPWPIWLNTTSFPVSFAEFDRYYVSALEQDKRTLAGKIGWVSFYRNLIAVFITILILQSFLTSVEVTLAGGMKIFGYDIIKPAPDKMLTTNTPAVPVKTITAATTTTAAAANENIIKPVRPQPIHGYEAYVIAAVVLAIIFLSYGYRAQIKSNERTFWDAYRRYELRKNLEIRYGDIALSFGLKDEYRTRALEYIIDRWFLAVESTVQTISRYLLSRLEHEYTKLDLKSKNKIKDIITDCYSNWNRGSYERVIANTLEGFKQIKSSIPTPDDWKLILGVFILENSLRTDAAFIEISNNLSSWGWKIADESKSSKDTGDKNQPKDDKVGGGDGSSSTSGNNTSTNPIPPKATVTNPPADKQKEKENVSEKEGQGYTGSEYYNVDQTKSKEQYDDIANLIRQTTDSYQLAFFEINAALRSIDSRLKKKSESGKPEEEQGLLDKPEEKERIFKKLRLIYQRFGGYEYENVRAGLWHLNDKYDNGLASIIIKGILKPNTNEVLTIEVGDIEGSRSGEAVITEIINPTPYLLNNLSYTDAINGKRSFCLKPYSLLRTNENEKVQKIELGENPPTAVSKQESLSRQGQGQEEKISIKILWRSELGIF